jgi:diacylglycerol kinase (ATP)
MSKESTAQTPERRPVHGTRVTIIVNPAAHNVPGPKSRKQADDWLREHGWTAQWIETTRPGEATDLARRAAADGVPLVIVCGGDGTINEAANGLAGTETALGMIRGGVSSIWAREIGIPKRPVDAVRAMITGELRKVDLGKAGDRYFLLMAGYGIDSAVVMRTSPRVKGRLGAAAYAIAAAREVISYRSTRARISLDGEDIDAHVLMLLAGNTQIYGGITRITPEAKADDGLLDVCVFKGKGRPDIIMHALRTLLRIHRRSDAVIFRRVKNIRFQWDTPLPLQMDGDAIDDSPAEVTVAPGALWVAVPTGVQNRIFTED